MIKSGDPHLAGREYGGIWVIWAVMKSVTLDIPSDESTLVPTKPSGPSSHLFKFSPRQLTSLTSKDDYYSDQVRI